jgi:hypothetical protein
MKCSKYRSEYRWPLTFGVTFLEKFTEHGGVAKSLGNMEEK